MCYLPSKIDSGFKKSTIFEGRGDVKDKHVEIELRLINELHPSDNDYVHVSILIFRVCYIKRVFQQNNLINTLIWRIFCK